MIYILSLCEIVSVSARKFLGKRAKTIEPECVLGLKQPHFSLDDRCQILPPHYIEGSQQFEIKF